MCGLFSTPKVTTPPPAPTVTDATGDDDVRAREKTRNRLRGSVNTGTSILSSGNTGGGGKSLLGQ